MINLYHKKRLWLGLFISWTLVLVILTLYPDFEKIVKEGTSKFRWDYIQHFLAYFGLGSLYVLWRGSTDFFIRGTELALLIAITIVFSILTEYIQVLIPGRAFNVLDMFYNVVGVLTGIITTYFIIIRFWLRKRYAGINEKST